jgi:hypothetical protein
MGLSSGLCTGQSRSSTPVLTNHFFFVHGGIVLLKQEMVFLNCCHKVGSTESSRGAQPVDHNLLVDRGMLASRLWDDYTSTKIQPHKSIPIISFTLFTFDSPSFIAMSEKSRDLHKIWPVPAHLLTYA